MSVSAKFIGARADNFILEESADNWQGDTAIILLNAGFLHSTGPFRLNTKLSKTLAERGALVIRLDQSGKGESPRRAGLSGAEGTVADYDSLMSYLVDRGIRQSILVGLCSGADDAVYMASQRDSVAGVVLLDGFAHANFRFYLHKLLECLRSPKLMAAMLKKSLFGVGRTLAGGNGQSPQDDFGLRDWPGNGEMVDRFNAILHRGGSVFAVFSSGQQYYNYRGQLKDILAADIDAKLLTETYFDTADHTYSTVESRDKLVTHIDQWIAKKLTDGVDP